MSYYPVYTVPIPLGATDRAAGEPVRSRGRAFPGRLTVEEGDYARSEGTEEKPA